MTAAGQGSHSIGHRKRPRPLVPGKTKPVRAVDVAEHAAAYLALAEARRRVANVTARLERQLGDAEIGTVDGQPVIRRRQYTTGGRYARLNHRDQLETT